MAAVALVGVLVYQNTDDDPVSEFEVTAAVDPSGDIWHASASEACDLAADEAVRISTDHSALVQLLKVRGVRMVEDNRDLVSTPTGTKDALVLKFRGTGVWSDGDTQTDVSIRVTVDSDDDIWIYYEPVS